MKVSAINYVVNDYQPRWMQITTDEQPEWAVRYLWINHRFHNVEFLQNYFTGGHTKGINVRQQTQHLSAAWKNHNSVFDESGINGNLVWRVKCLNEFSCSIDYVEVWRSPDIIKQLFDLTPTLSNGQQWTDLDKQQLGQGIYDAGFEVRHLIPYRSISKRLAIEHYQQFVRRNQLKNNCIINTAWNSHLNPL